jgi:hypothetical protein
LLYKKERRKYPKVKKNIFICSFFEAQSAALRAKKIFEAQSAALRAKKYLNNNNNF